MNIVKKILSLSAACILMTNTVAYAEKAIPIYEKYGFTLEEEVEIGFQAALALTQKYGYYKNSMVNFYVTNVGEGVAEKISKRPELKYKFIVLDSDQVNAFAAPGGFVLITKGALKVIDNEAELASVLAHEITHVEDGHGLETIASDPRLKEKLIAIKGSVDSGEALSQKMMERFTKELDKNKGAAALVNFDRAMNADVFEGSKIK